MYTTHEPSARLQGSGTVVLRKQLGSWAMHILLEVWGRREQKHPGRRASKSGEKLATQIPAGRRLAQIRIHVLLVIFILLLAHISTTFEPQHENLVFLQVQRQDPALLCWSECRSLTCHRKTVVPAVPFFEHNIFAVGRKFIIRFCCWW